MTLEEAKLILGDWVKPNGDLYGLGSYISWTRGKDWGVCLDDTYSMSTLEAIVIYVKSFEQKEDL